MPINLLLIDDMRIAAEGLKRLLEVASPEYKLYWATEDAKAFEILEKVPEIKLIYCETTLHNEVSGPTIGRHIREEYPDLRIIGVSAVDYIKSGVPARNAWSGFDYLDKNNLSIQYFRKLLVELKRT
jgi:DNA-binding NtrC family response regulator